MNKSLEKFAFLEPTYIRWGQETKQTDKMYKSDGENYVEKLSWDRCWTDFQNYKG